MEVSSSIQGDASSDVRHFYDAVGSLRFRNAIIALIRATQRGISSDQIEAMTSELFKKLFQPSTLSRLANHDSEMNVSTRHRFR